MHLRRVVHILLSLGCLLGVLRAEVRAAEAMQVTLADGRVVKGIAHSATNESWLAILRRESAVELVSHFAWEQVTGGEIGGVKATRHELQVWALKHQVNGRTIQEFASQQTSIVDSPAPVVSARVKTLVIQAQLAQWDNDVASDGIRLHVAPLDERGELVPVQGQISLTLVGEQMLLQGGQSYVGPPTFRELARRSFMVRKEDFANGPAIYELPFTPQHPDADPNLAATALLHARLGIPGQGVFEASDSHVQVKEFSWFRDQLQYYTPGRYLPIEAGLQNR